MGFCLPGAGRPLCTTDEIWEVVSQGRTMLVRDQIYTGRVEVPEAMFGELSPALPELYARHFTSVHRMALVSMAEACADAKLDAKAGDLVDAAVISGRAGIDTNVPAHVACDAADPATLTIAGAMQLVVGARISGTPADVAMVQSALTRSTGPSFTIVCGCASAAVALGRARELIAAGEADLVLVSGTDAFNTDLLQRHESVLRVAERPVLGPAPTGSPKTMP